jgi:hypothetical protein
MQPNRNYSFLFEDRLSVLRDVKRCSPERDCLGGLRKASGGQRKTDRN